MPEALGCPIVPKRADAALEVIGLNVVLVMGIFAHGASVTLFASMPLTAKYPLSEASAEPARPPKAKAWMQESAVSGSERFSPSLRAISAMDLNMMIVETGSSMARLASPNAPPAAPDAVARALCRKCEAA
jgi:hypothetical protein